MEAGEVMYFLPLSSGRPLAAVGSYHREQTASPVAMGEVSVRSPYFEQLTPYPYIRGPIYTRPVFKEYTRQGNFSLHPIVKMPSLGETPAADDLPTLPSPPPLASPESVCSMFASMPDIHQRCLEFNGRLAGSTSAEQTKILEEMQKADSACSSKTLLSDWASCYYSRLQPAWYENPIKLGGVVLAGCGLLGLLIMGLKEE